MKRFAHCEGCVVQGKKKNASVFLPMRKQAFDDRFPDA